MLSYISSSGKSIVMNNRILLAFFCNRKFYPLFHIKLEKLGSFLIFHKSARLLNSHRYLLVSNLRMMYGALVSVSVVILQTMLTPDIFAFETKLPSIYFLLDIFGSKQNTAFFLIPPDFDWSYCFCSFNRLIMER